MPYLTDLDQALTAAGFDFWPAPGWRGRGIGPMAGVRGVLIHHTGNGKPDAWQTVLHGRGASPGVEALAGPLAHMTFERDGGVRLLAAGLAQHSGTGRHPLIGVNNGNRWLIGIEGVSPGLGAGVWTDAQRRGYPRLAAALCRHYRLPARAVLGHKEWAPGRKPDPGDWHMNDFRAEVDRHLAARRILPDVHERPLAHGRNVGTIICPTGTSSAVTARAWISARIAGGGRVRAWFQMTADADGPAPGAGRPVDWTLRSAQRGWVEVPSGTEYVEFDVDANGTGSIAVEVQPK